MQEQLIQKILECMAIEVLVGDPTVKWDHDVAAMVPTKEGSDLQGYTKLSINNRQLLQQVKFRILSNDDI